jgi:hypothetical protein
VLFSKCSTHEAGSVAKLGSSMNAAINRGAHACGETMCPYPRATMCRLWRASSPPRRRSQGRDRIEPAGEDQHGHVARDGLRASAAATPSATRRRRRAPARKRLRAHLARAHRDVRRRDAGRVLGARHRVVQRVVHLLGEIPGDEHRSGESGP